MTLCRGALGLSEPTWYIRLPPVSEDKCQYSTPRGGQGQAVSSGFEPAKVLVRGLPLPRPRRLPRPFRKPTRPTRGVGQHRTARRDPWWTGCKLVSQPARHWHCAPTRTPGSQKGQPLSGPQLLFFDPMWSARSYCCGTPLPSEDSGKVALSSSCVTLYGAESVGYREEGRVRRVRDGESWCEHERTRARSGANGDGEDGSGSESGNERRETTRGDVLRVPAVGTDFRDERAARERENTR
ncbi:hypothetical protein EDB83DRAFT_2322433 [Lactarius deliciosus]|nr:hypothetical protein EDB83DRAFT_2322433 [Lactarius deliciosus]